MTTANLNDYDQVRTIEIDEENDARHLATVCTATPEEIAVMLDTPVGDDGRSEWSWLRLQNGDLVFGCFPKGDTYETLSQGSVTV